jgi:hypothetical protein
MESRAKSIIDKINNGSIKIWFLGHIQKSRENDSWMCPQN